MFGGKKIKCVSLGCNNRVKRLSVTRGAGPRCDECKAAMARERARISRERMQNVRTGAHA